MVRPSIFVIAAFASVVVAAPGATALGLASPPKALEPLLEPLEAAPAATAEGPVAPMEAAVTAPAPPAPPAAPTTPIPALPPAPAAPAAPAVLAPLLPVLAPVAPLAPQTSNDTVVADAPRDSLGRANGPAGASSGSAGAGGAPPTGLGSQTVAADLGPQEGIGPALQRGAADAFTGPGSWYDSWPGEAKAAAGAFVGVLLTGLAIAGAYLTGFRHIGRENLLVHNTRQELLDLVREEPGIHQREVARRLGMTTTNAGYHLRVLERHGLIRSARLNGKRVYMPAGGRDANQRHLAQALLRRESRAQVAAILLDKPGINQIGLAHAVGQHQGAVGWHLAKLVAAGVVQEERTPRECRYRLTAMGEEIVRAELAHAPRVVELRVAPVLASVEPAQLAPVPERA